MKTLILYHANCADGFAAAWATYQSFGDNAVYLPVQYGAGGTTEQRWEELTKQLGDEQLIDRDVYILDFSFPPEIIFKIADYIRSGEETHHHVTQLDHHKSAMGQWADSLVTHQDSPNEQFYSNNGITVIFDMTRSGAQMAWDYFNHNTVLRPGIVDYVADRDLWQFYWHDTKALCAGLNTLPKTFADWSYASDHLSEIIAKGYAVLDFQQSQIDKASTPADLRSVRLGDFHGLATNCCNNISEVGNAIAKQSGTFSLSFFIKDNDAICSLRSIAPFDVSVLAKQYGGGGHAQAAGFKLPINRFFSEIWK